MGDSKGSNPTLATSKAKAMVAKGADKALPTTVRRSKEMPNTDKSKRDDKHHQGSECIEFNMDSCVEKVLDRRDIVAVAGGRLRNTVWDGEYLRWTTAWGRIFSWLVGRCSVRWYSDVRG